MKGSPFQIIVLVLFAVALVGGVIVLALTKGTNRGGNVPITLWGTIPAASLRPLIEDLTQTSAPFRITYVEKRSESFDQDLVEALASGSGPDAILLSQDMVVRHGDKIARLPYDTMSARVFKDTFIQEGELYLDSAGIVALPFSVDPLVMYWNRDMFANAGVAQPPQTWDQFIALAPKLTVKDKNLNIVKSAVALGEFQNIDHAKEILATFLLQTGNPLSAYGPTGTLTGRLYPSTLGSVGAVNFYTDFANPVKPDYSWNRALPNSRDMFAAGDLAVYFGFASEISKIRDKNPNLNFDVSYFPQPKSASVAVTFGTMQGIAVMKNSPNVAVAFQAALTLSGPGSIAQWIATTNLPPVRRDLLSANPSDPYQAVFYNSAIRARGWLDPNPLSSGTVFKNMVESVTGGALEAGDAINAAGQFLNNLFK